MLAAAVAEHSVAPMQRARGMGRVETRLRDGKTEPLVFFQEGAAKIRLPHTHDNSLEAVLINTAGGLTGGDDIRWQVDAAPGTSTTLTTQACERVYRSLGTDARVTTKIRVRAGAHVDWLPQETILFDHSRLARTLDIELDEGASLTALEAFVLGREAMGEDARTVTLGDDWRIRRAGRLLHAEATRLSGSNRERDAASLLDGRRAFATMVHIGPRAERLAGVVVDHISGRPEIGVSLIGERLIVRAMAESGLALRRLFVPVIALLSGTGRVPRLWSI